MTEVAIQQDLSVCERVQGNLLVRIYDTEGSMMEENIAIEDDIQDWQFKYTRRFKKKKAEDGTDAPTETEALAQGRKYDCSIAWIRMDPDLDWMRKITFPQPEFMLINQLEEDRDVISQFEAIDDILNLKKTFHALESLFRVLNNQNIYYEVRMKAALSISEVSLYYNFKSTFF